MGKMILTVLAGVLLITLATVPASAAGMETAVPSVADSTSPPVVLALAAGHSAIHTSSGVVVPNPQTRPTPCRSKAGFYADATRAVPRPRNSSCW
jgi:hypothetical protein